MIPSAEGELPDPNTVGPGMGALVVFIFLLVAGFFLIRSMRKQLKRVDFPEEQATPKDAAPDTEKPAST